MDDQSKSTEPNNVRVAAALRDYLERVDRGETVDREKFLLQHAPIAAELRSFIVAEDEVRKLANAEASLDDSHDSTRSFAAHGQETVGPQVVVMESAQPEEMKLVGQFGRYRIIRALGKGAMGTVYLAEDTHIERQVALKMPHFTEDPTGEQRERFFREARAAGTLRHPHICPVYDFGQIDGKHYISLAYIEGHPLSAFIQPRKPQTERQILIVIRKLALALQEAHDHAIVHRDLKPSNIMVDKRGEPIIMDFGLAQQARRNEDARLTQTGSILGTPAFMSPEQIEGDPTKIGPPSDQYSLGVVLFELLTGELPFQGPLAAVMAQILTKEPPRPSQLRSEIDQRVEAVCLKMMAKKPSARFPSMTAVADEIANILKSPAATIATKKTPASAGAESLSEGDLVSLEQRARDCYARHDFEQVIEFIESVSEKRRNAVLQSLLQKSLDKTDEIAFLICEIDEAVRLNDRPTALRKAEDLLKINPRHRRAREIQKKHSGNGEKGGLVRQGPLRHVAQAWNKAGWNSWIVLAIGLAVFAAAMGVIVIHLRGTAVVIRIDDPGVEVTVKGTTISVNGPDKQKVTVEPGEQQLTITYAGLQFVTKEGFEIKKGQNRTVTVSVVSNKIAAKLDDQFLALKPGPGVAVGTQMEVASEGAPQKTTGKTTGIANADVRPLLGASRAATAPQNGRQQSDVSLAGRIEVTNSIGMKMALIPAGEFLMGAGNGESARAEELPQHRVRITKPFYLSAYEMTQGEFERVMGRNPSYFSALGNGKELISGKDTSRFPVENVSWFDAIEFCNKLSESEKRPRYYLMTNVARNSEGSIPAADVVPAGGEGYRLPTEAEWEYACRTGTATPFHFGFALNGGEANCNGTRPYGTTKKGPYLRRTTTVGSYNRPTTFGLFDMHGNVREWCWDAYDENYYAQSPGADPISPHSGTNRVNRGGSFVAHGVDCRAAHRSHDLPNLRSNRIGFRVARFPVGNHVVEMTPVEKQTAVVVPGTPAVGPKRDVSTTPPNDDRTARLVTPGETAAKRAQQQWAERLKSPVILTNSLGTILALIPAGEFQMGSPNFERERYVNEHQHRVRITKPFYLGVYEITQSEFQQVMGRNPSPFANGGGRTDTVSGVDTGRNPVEHVSWYDAVEFCNKLSEKEGRRPYYGIADVERGGEGSIRAARVSVEEGGGYRLPTEAQWEYACRAGTTTPFNFGTLNTAAESNCNGKQPYGTEERGAALGRTVPVGSYRPNAFGLYDMHGNVWEWCWDMYDKAYYENSPMSDPTGPSWGSYRIHRGGCWGDSGGSCRSAIRHRDPPERRNFPVGFRLARNSGE